MMEKRPLVVNEQKFINRIRDTQFQSHPLASSHVPPALHISYVTLITSDVCSIRTQVPCKMDITRYSTMIPVRSKRIPFIVH